MLGLINNPLYDLTNTHAPCLLEIHTLLVLLANRHPPETTQKQMINVPMNVKSSCVIVLFYLRVSSRMRVTLV